ncbi:hypothetical protein CEXT_121571 [Caerostris extrusa]|uniref:Uncharacterized protein n=1 Tax=Caerostris extrusa TaxID=172846 RepID=A0AAV4RIH6_CAEEX|nr:hypothetical protein CEXT_121571 [Caerostris extrusa]
MNCTNSCNLLYSESESVPQPSEETIAENRDDSDPESDSLSSITADQKLEEDDIIRAKHAAFVVCGSYGTLILHLTL